VVHATTIKRHLMGVSFDDDDRAAPELKAAVAAIARRLPA
jgi:hypothetical protein